MELPQSAVAGAGQSRDLALGTSGARLDAGLAADQATRAEREGRLRRKLGRLHRLDAAVRAGGVIAGFLEILLLVLMAASALGFGHRADGGVLGIGATFLCLLGICGAAAPIVAWERRRLLKQGERNGVVLSVSLVATAPTCLEEGTGEHGPEAQVAQLEREVKEAYRDERSLGEICLWGGYSILAVGALVAIAAYVVELRIWTNTTVDSSGTLLALLFGLGALVAAYLVLILAAVTLFMLPFAAPLSVFYGHRRRRLLRDAKRLGYVVRDPARYPGE